MQICCVFFQFGIALKTMQQNFNFMRKKNRKKVESLLVMKQLEFFEFYI